MEKRSGMTNRYDIWTLMDDYYIFMSRYIKDLDNTSYLPYLIAVSPMYAVIAIFISGILSYEFLWGMIMVFFVFVCAYFGGYLKTEGEEK